MSHISEFLEQVNETPRRRKANVSSAWDCFTTASKTARLFRSQVKSVNRQVTYTADIIASNEEFEHPESKALIAKTPWNVYRVSPLWNLKFKKTKNKQRSLDETEYNIAERLEYDEGALKRYSNVILGYLQKEDLSGGGSEFESAPCAVKISPLPGLRGSRNDKDALKIEVILAHEEIKRTVFVGILCGIEPSELQISASNGTSLPVLLVSGNVDTADRVIYGLTKCFDCVISPLEFSGEELLWVSALWTGLEVKQSTENTTVDCTIQPRKSKRGRKALGDSSNVSANKTSNQTTINASKDAKKAAVNVKQEMSFHYAIPLHLTGARAKINSLTFTLKSDEVRELWNCIHREGETEFTEAEMQAFHGSLNLHIKECLGIDVEKLKLETIRLPFVTISARGQLKIQHEDHVKNILRHLTVMCQGDMLCSNPSLGAPAEEETTLAA